MFPSNKFLYLGMTLMGIDQGINNVIIKIDPKIQISLD
jgi:hypothetical protein